jgi:acetoin utilization protein AcuB
MARKTTPVKDYMTPHPHSIGRDQKLSTAHELMRKYEIRHLPVLDGGHVVGLVSLRDLHLIETLPDVKPNEITVEEAMSSDPYTVPPTMSLGELAREMAAHKYGAAIVVEHNKIVGVFTTVDALRALSDALG